MTFRARLTALTSLAVAIGVVATSVTIYYTYRHDLIRQVDGELRASLKIPPLSNVTRQAASGPIVVSKNAETNHSSTRFRVQLPNSSTAVEVHAFSPVSFPDGERASNAPQFSTLEINGSPVRRLTIYGAGETVTITRSLSDVTSNLSRLRWLLFAIAVAGTTAATLLGAFLSGRAIAPLRRLTEATERIAATGDLSARTRRQGRDEISRLSAQLDRLLAGLEQSVQSQRQLVADASHELRTPLAAIRANVGLLARPEGLNPADRAELVADLEEGLESMTSLIAELLELAHGEETELSFGPIRLDELVQSSISRVVKQDHRVVFHTALEPTMISGVADRVERAVDNLLDNACKWSPDGETIDVRVDAGVVEIRDRGPGLSPEDVPLIFNRFYRAAQARGTPGAGLGLAIVKQVAEIHGGTITASSAPGGGAIFRLAFTNSLDANES